MDSGLQPESIGDVVTRAGQRAGIEIRFTGHSPRRGLATSSRLKGHDQIVIAKQGGWAPHSKVLAGYLDVVDQWEDNALLGVLQTGLARRTGPPEQPAAPVTRHRLDRWPRPGRTPSYRRCRCGRCRPRPPATER
jgi:hypothetical protein